MVLKDVIYRKVIVTLVSESTTEVSLLMVDIIVLLCSFSTRTIKFSENR